MENLDRVELISHWEYPQYTFFTSRWGLLDWTVTNLGWVSWLWQLRYAKTCYLSNVYPAVLAFHVEETNL